MGLDLAPYQVFADSTMEYVRWKRWWASAPGGASNRMQYGGGSATTTGSEGTITVTSSISTNGNSYTTGGVSGNVAGWNLNAYHSRAHYYRHCIAIEIPTITSVRVWCGLSATTLANQGASDTPAQSYAAFRFSTGASDTKWMCCTDSGSGSPTVVSAGGPNVAANTYYNLQLYIDPILGTISFYINGNFRQILSTTLPTTGTLLAPMVVVTTLTAATRVVNVHHGFGRTRLL